MAVNTNTIVSNVYAQNYTPGSKEKTKVARNTETGEVREGNGIQRFGKDDW